MKKTTLLGVMAILCLYLSAQQKPINPLTIGDTVPNITFNNVINHTSKTAKLSDFKGKLIILDFWSSWCARCIQLFPYMDSLQKQFKGDIKIILLNARSKQNKNDSGMITGIIKRVEKKTGCRISLPVVYDAPELDTMFPHKYLPHEVILDANGKVLAITSAEEINPANIKALLARQQIELHRKADDFNFTTDKPLFINGNGGNGSTILSYSVFAPYTEGVGCWMTGDSQTRLCFYNYFLFDIMRFAYPKELSLSRNRIILDDSVSRRLLGDETPSWDRTFCYNLILPRTTQDAIYQQLKADIQRTFHLQAQAKEREMNCWVLTANPQLSKAYTKGGNPGWFGMSDPYSKNKYIQNKSAEDIAYLLSTFFAIPVIDETGIKQHLDLKLPQNLEDTTGLIQSLQNAGLNMRRATRKIPVTVIFSQQP